MFTHKPSATSAHPSDLHMHIQGKAVGYIRVSTEKQESEGNGLNNQAQRIREACESLGYNLLSILEDTESVTSAQDLSARPGLSDALSLARSERAILVVSDGTRLFRNSRAYEDFRMQYSGEIYSVREGKFLDRDELAAIVAAGEVAARNIHDGTRTALEQKKTSGQRLGSPHGLSAANKASALARKAKSDELAGQIAAVIKGDPAYKDLSNGAFADLLNRRGILTNQRKHWSEAGVRRLRKRAMEMIEEERQLEEELDAAETSMRDDPSYSMF